MQVENCKLEIANCRGRQVLRGNRRSASLSIYPFQCSIFNLHSLAFLFALGVILLALCSASQAQTIADKTVATVTNGARANPDLITYSDLLWQLTLEPAAVFDPRPGSADLNRALKTLEDQLLILQEARKLPLAQTAEAQKEFDDMVKQRRDELAQLIGPRALEARMARVGLTSEQLNAILRDRVTIDRYLDFRFRAFVLVGAQEIADRYEKIYRPQRNRGVLVPTLEQARDRIERELTEEKIAEQIGKFVDDLREQPGTEIVVLNPL